LRSPVQILGDVPPVIYAHVRGSSRNVLLRRYCCAWSSARCDADVLARRAGSVHHQQQQQHWRRRANAVVRRVTVRILLLLRRRACPWSCRRRVSQSPDQLRTSRSRACLTVSRRSLLRTSRRCCPPRRRR